MKKEFQLGQMVLLFNSRLKLFPGKLKSRWTGPYRINKILSKGAVELVSLQSGKTFLVNGQRLKPYLASNAENENQEHCVNAMFLKDF